MYKLIFTRYAKRQLLKLQKGTQKRILASLKRCKVRPHAHIKKLENLPYFSLRSGDYRVILRIEENELKILVIRLGHRKNIYKK
jgi:mRNA interferase RelE/StbE